MAGSQGCLSGTTILCAAPARNSEAQLVECVKQLGGTAIRLEDVGDGDLNADFLVSDGVLTEAYKVVQNSTTWMAKLSPSWLVACEEANQKVPVEDYQLKSFSGITVCMSGGASGQKQKYSDAIRRHDGEYSPELTRMCTHLVIARTKKGETRTVSEKERHARQWGSIHVVWDSWLADNAESGFYKANEPQHAVPAPTTCVVSVKAKRFTKPSQHSQGLQKGAQANASSVGQSSSTVNPDSRNPDKGEGSCASHPSVGRWLVPNENKAESHLNVPAARTGQEHNACNAPQEDPAQDAMRESNAKCPQEDSPSEDDNDTLFLSGALMHLACCTPEEQLEMIRILREGGCTRRPDLSHDVTHVVVGSDLTGPEVQAMTQHAKKQGHVCVLATLDWLRRCLKERILCPVLEKDKVDPARLLPSLPPKAALNPKIVAPAKADTGHVTASQAANDANSNAGWATNRCFEGCFFTLSALRGTDDEAVARKLVRQGGGRCYDYHTLSLVTHKDKAFAVCPPSLPTKTRHTLCKGSPDFNLVWERNHVTLRWLDICLDSEQLLSPVPADLVECQPIPFPLPLQGMKDIVVTASNMEDQEKDRIKLVVKLLGGSYTVKMSARNTHLIVPFADGPKFLGSQRFGVKPVTCAWLIDVAKSGKLLPEGSYLPPPPGATEVANHSQFPFEGPANTQESSRLPRPGTQRQPSLLQQVIGQPEQSTQGGRQMRPPPTRSAAGPRASQGPSKLDALFSQLKTPVKSSQRPKTTPLKDKVWKQKKGSKAVPATKMAGEDREQGKQISHPENPSTAVPQEPADMDSPGQEIHGVLTAHEGGKEELAGIGSADDMGAALALMGNALEDLPEALKHSSQHEAFLPAKSRGSEASGGLSRRSSPGETKSRGPKRPSRQDSNTSQDGVGARKRAKGSSGVTGRVQDLEAAALMECSQRVGYEGLLPSALHGLRPRGPSRMSKSSKAATEADNELAKQRLVNAVSRI